MEKNPISKTLSFRQKWSSDLCRPKKLDFLYSVGLRVGRRKEPIIGYISKKD